MKYEQPDTVCLGTLRNKSKERQANVTGNGANKYHEKSSTFHLFDDRDLKEKFRQSETPNNNFAIHFSPTFNGL